MARHVGLLPSVARTAAVVSPDIWTYPGEIGLIVVIDCTAVAATPTATFTIEGKDPTSSKYYTILASAGITTTGTTVLRVHPQLTAVANTVAKDLLPAIFRVSVAHGDTDSITYSVSASIS